MGKPDMKTILAGDIGGSKTSLALYHTESGPRRPISKASFVSGSYPSLTSILAEFLGEDIPRIDAACFGVAGPVVEASASITNLEWCVSEGELRSFLRTPNVSLINDLVAVASGIPLLGPDDLLTINPGTPDPCGTIAVIAPGTGLGEAYLTHDGSGYSAHPSEGGHADFAPTDALQSGLLSYLLEKYDHVSYERVCSGIGIPAIYAYFRDRLGYEEPPWLSNRLAQARDPAIVIREAAQDDETVCELCRMTMQTFVRILGAEAGNLALKLLPTGGLYLAGGLPPRIATMLSQGGFMDAFASKGRLSSVVRRVPVHVVMDTDVALLGAASRGIDSLPR